MFFTCQTHSVINIDVKTYQTVYTTQILA